MQIEIDSLTFRYFGMLRKNEPLRGLSWSVGPGITGLIGPNGGGKTTLIKVISTLITPTEGDVFIDGRSVSHADVRKDIRRRMGLLPQEPQFVPSMASGATLEYIAWAHGIPRSLRPKKVADALSSVGLSRFTDAPVSTLSGGQRRRLAIAATVVHDPELVILDEPTVGLDPGARLDVRAMLRDIGAERTVLLSTHLVEDVRYLCDRVGILADGRIVFSGEYRELEKLVPERSQHSTLGSTFELAYRELMSHFSGKR